MKVTSPEEASVIVVGSVNSDTIMYLDKLPMRHQTVLGNQTISSLGGKGANQAIAASRAGGQVQLIAAIGDDAVGAECLSKLRKHGVDISLIMELTGKPTGNAVVLVDRDGDNMIAVSPGANSDISAQLVKESLSRIRARSVALFQLETPIDIVASGLKVAQSSSAITVLNPAPYLEGVMELLPMCDVVTPNQAEASALSGGHVQDWNTAKFAAEYLLSRGAGAAVVTLGRLGCFVRTATSEACIPCLDVGRAVDTTGAGDVFNGVLSVGLSEGKTLIEAAKFASTASALSVKIRSASESAPLRRSIDELMLSRPIYPI